ncbi:MAG: OprO/OprP family phosphate-selective porin [Marinifilaceae bacterium]
MRNKKLLLITALFSVFTLNSQAQAFVESLKDDFEWRLRGRFLVDGGGFTGTSELKNGLALADLRLGAQIKFLKHWGSTMEIGYTNNKVSVKDVFVNYKLDNNTFQVGHYFEPFGESRIGTTNFKLMAESPAIKAFTPGRKLGGTYQYSSAYFNATVGAFSNYSISDSPGQEQGYAFSSRIIGRPIYNEGNVLQLAVTPVFSTPAGENKVERFSAGLPTSIITGANNRFVDATVTQVINTWKMECELVGIYEKWFVKGNYTMAHVNRFGADNYRGQGATGELGYLLIGQQQNYNPSMGFVANPAPGSVELLARYSYLDLNDKDAGIKGGILQNVTVGASYYINKFVAFRLNYTYSNTKVGNEMKVGPDDVNMIQGRLQFAF